MIYVRSASGRVLAGYVAAGWLSGAVGAGAAVLAALLGPGAFARGALAFGVSAEDGRLLALFFAFLAAAAGIAALSLYIGFRSTAELRARLSELADASALYAAGKLGHRVRVDADGDVDGDVAVTARQMNLMAERLSEQVGILQTQAQDNLNLRRQLEAGAALRERERVSRELHDRVSQELFGLAMLCETASRQREKAPDKALELLPELSALARRAQRAMRGLLLELRPAELAGRPLEEALRALCLEVSDRAGVTVEFSVSRRGGDGLPLPDGVEDGLFLIAQEALTNALRHSGASRIEVGLTLEPERALVEIRDHGAGIKEGKEGRDRSSSSEPQSVPADPGSASLGQSAIPLGLRSMPLGPRSMSLGLRSMSLGLRSMSLGLRSMEERARLLGGECTVRSREGEGTEVVAIIPRVPPKQQGGV